jgi:hypothetical protein
MIGRCSITSRRPAGTREIPFSRSNYRRWDMGLPWHEVRDCLASGWRRTASPYQKTIASEKRMLIVFWGILWIAYYCWLPKDNTLDSPFLYEEVLRPLARSENAAKFQNIHKPLTLIHMDNSKVHTARATQEKLDVSRFKLTRQSPYSLDIAPSNFRFRLAENPSWTGII